ncbi:ketopantoate reductase family protein [Elioraea rosea]|uniref:ketopantoate reductase family protein n=1 Tax=Elioraea rosea TaxID=2492390 RepID=UPI001183167C|nr:2-dehydropantoate 2-reductase N-terminal domain-containing protein [Elioraea rosea]
MPGDPILIWGAGAIGGTVGAYLVRAGHDVTFVDIVEEHVRAIADASHGLAITGPVEEFSVSAPAFLPGELAGTWRKVFLCVKAHHTEEAAKALTPHLAADGYVLSLQNGLCETVIERVVGRERTMGAFVNFGADWMGPGEILYGNRGAVVLGELDGRITGRLESLHRLMLDFDDRAIMTDNIWGYLWGKLAYGAMLFAQALGQDSIAGSLANPALFRLWRALGGEVMAVAEAEGVRAEGFNGFDPAAFGRGGTEAAAQASVDAMVAHNRASAKTHSGVWRDLAVRKRRTEVDVQIGPIPEIAARHGLATPLVDRLVAMIHEIEEGRRPMTDANLLELAGAVPA